MWNVPPRYLELGVPLPGLEWFWAIDLCSGNYCMYFACVQLFTPVIFLKLGLKIQGK